MILVSACLVGINCRYDGKGCKNENIITLVSRNKAIPVCPEQLGELPTPRKPAEIVNGDGYDVLIGLARVINTKGVDVSDNFILGAQKVLRIAQILKVEEVFFKSKSPSCGCKRIYNGAFNGKLKEEVGVCSALLIKNGITVNSIE
ncbi:MAG: DUF523 domain-containing protein [bacterium]|nr:DUF523 domain-containing protein [bacterium]